MLNYLCERQDSIIFISLNRPGIQIADGIPLDVRRQRRRRSKHIVMRVNLFYVDVVRHLSCAPCFILICFT